MITFELGSIISDIRLPQGSDRWKAFRKGKIGSSMAPIIMGASPWKTRLQLWEDMLLGHEDATNYAMARGKTMEPIARDYLNKKYGLALEPVVVTHPELSWHISSLDGFSFNYDTGEGTVTEIKCPGSEDHSMALDGIIPQKYIPQLDHQLESLPLIDSILYCSYTPNSQIEILHYRDEARLAHQLEAEKAFFESMQNFEPPAPEARDVVQIHDSNAIHEANILCALMAQKRFVEERIDAAKDKLKAYANHPRIQVGDIKINRSVRRGQVDYDAIPQLAGVNKDAFRKKATEFWTFSDTKN